MQKLLRFFATLHRSAFFPGLEQFLILHGLAFGLLVRELGFGCTRLSKPLAFGDRLIELRSTLALHASALETRHHLVHLFGKIVHCRFRSNGTSDRFTDVLPPQLGKLRIVGHVGTAWRPHHTRWATIELD